MSMCQQTQGLNHSHIADRLTSQTEENYKVLSSSDRRVSVGSSLESGKNAPELRENEFIARKKIYIYTLKINKF